MDHRATLEMIAPTVDEAVEKALDQLGLSRDQVEVDVLDEGGGGLFGLGGRQARVRIIVLGDDEVAEDQATFPASQTDVGYDSETENVMAIAKATVRELLEHMGVRAEVSTRLGEADERDEDAPIVVDIHGGDLSILIGRRAETLDALQMITRMIVGKELGQGVHLIVDVEGYRSRRERNLRQLAQRMAGQAIKTGRRQSLEPMSPAERRIIHLELRDSKEVYTESAGEEPKRKVVIIPEQT